MSFFRCIITSVIILTCFFSLYAQPGKDGSRTISSANTFINEYTTLSSDATAGNSFVAVAQSGLNNNNRFAAALAPGDLVMIYQAAGALVSGSFYTSGSNTYGLPKDSLWGAITAYNGAGNYEWQTVAGVLGNTILLQCPLSNSYSVAGKTQVIRIPRWTSLTLNAPGSITCELWDGAKGGVVAAEVQGNCVINGSITTNAQGFRGGMSAPASAILGAGDVASTDNSVGADRGEGIAGYGTELNYAGGRYGRGAAANAGGGGTAHNAGGGGGANGGNPANFTGYGVPNLTTASWNPAWNLLLPNFVSTSFSGGGMGGLSASSGNQNALTLAPGNAAWNGDSRRRVGGYGGRPLDHSGPSIFMGGGGGAGNSNDAPTNSNSGAGGRGGGIVFLYCTGSVSGTGSISANGQAGINATWTATGFNVAGQDGAGGGGGGGSIVIDGTNMVSIATITAIGGTGGNQVISGFNAAGYNQAQGPGGGGGGGYVQVPLAALSPNVNGGLNGTTNAGTLNEFPPNGATKGGIGTTNVIALQTFQLVNDTICTGQTATFNITGSPNNSYTYQWYDAAFNGNLLGTGNTFTTAALSTNTDFFVQVCPLHYRLRVKAVVLAPSAGIVAGADQQTCTANATLSASLPLSSSGAWSVLSGSGTFSSVSNPAAQVSNLTQGVNKFVWTVSGSNCIAGSDTVTITRLASAPQALAGSDQSVCANSFNLNGNASGGMSVLWTVLSGGATISAPGSENTPATGLSAGANVFEYSINPGNGCPLSRDTVQITAVVPPSQANAGPDLSVCGSSISLQGQIPANGNPQWTVLSGTATVANAVSPVSQVNGLSAGINTFLLTISQANCSSTYDTVVVNRISSPPPAQAGTDQTVCGFTVQLTGNSPPGVTSQWNVLSGSTAVLSNPVLSSTQANNLVAGTNRFEYIINPGNGCPLSRDTVQITAVVPPSQANAGPDLSVCGSSISLQGQIPANGNPQWTVLSGTATVANAVSPVSQVNGLSAGINTFLLTISQANCSSTYDTVRITSVSSPAPANAGNDANVCGTTWTMQALSPAPANGTWTVNTGTALLSNPSDPNATASGLSNGIVRLVWSVALTGCPTTHDTITLQVQIPEIPEAGNNRSICGDTVHLAGNAINATWSSNMASDIIQNNGLSSPVVTGLQPGLHIFRWTTPAGICPQQYDSVKIQVLTAPVSQAGNDTTICGSTLQLHAQSPTTGTGTWTSGAGSIASSANPTTTVSALTQGTHTFYWTVQVPGCQAATDSVKVIVYLPPSQALAGPNDTICGSQLLLAGNAPANGTAAWSSNTPGVTVNGNMAVFAQTGSFRMVYTVSSGTCPPSKDSLQVLVGPSLLPNAGTDKTTCADSITLQGTSNAGLLSWTAQGAGNLSSQGGTTHITSLPQGVHSFVLHCKFQGCPVVTDTVRVNRTSAPVSVAGADVFACGFSASLQAQLQAGTTGQWQAPASVSLSDLISPNASITVADTGTYTLVWKITLPGCPTATDTVRATFYGFSSPVQATADTTIALGDTLVLSIPGAITAVWSQSNFLSCMTCLAPRAYPVQDEIFYVAYTDSLGCAFNDSVAVKVDKNNYAELPTAFSPNNDGNNDFLYIHHNGIKDIQMSVYSEYGEEVFSISGKAEADKQWDGGFRGKVLMPQVLVFMMQGVYLDGKSFSKSGKIMLLR